MKKLAVAICIILGIISISVGLSGCGKSNCPPPPALDITPVEPGEEYSTPAPSSTPTEEDQDSEYPSPCQSDYIDCLVALETPCAKKHDHKQRTKCWKKGVVKCQREAAKCAGRA